MGNRIVLFIFLFTVFSSMLFSCAHLPPKSYQTNETVILNNIQFRINSVKFTSSFYNWVGQPSYPNATFLIVDISITNLRKESIPFHFRPVFSLIDENGTKYEKSEEGTIMINMGQRGGFFPTENLNPNVTYTTKIVFDVPRQKYKLQVLVPWFVEMGFGGYQKLTGRFFYFDLSSIQ